MRVAPNAPDSYSPAAALQKAREASGKGSEAAGESAAASDDQVSLSPQAQDFVKALGHLNEIEAPRPEAVERGKDVIANWQTPSQEQVDHIADSLLDEL